MKQSHRAAKAKPWDPATGWKGWKPVSQWALRSLWGSIVTPASLPVPEGQVLEPGHWLEAGWKPVSQLVSLDLNLNLAIIEIDIDYSPISWTSSPLIRNLR